MEKLRYRWIAQHYGYSLSRTIKSLFRIVNETFGSPPAIRPHFWIESICLCKRTKQYIAIFLFGRFLLSFLSKIYGSMLSSNWRTMVLILTESFEDYKTKIVEREPRRRLSLGKNFTVQSLDRSLDRSLPLTMLKYLLSFFKEGSPSNSTKFKQYISFNEQKNLILYLPYR